MTNFHFCDLSSYRCWVSLALLLLLSALYFLRHWLQDVLCIFSAAQSPGSLQGTYCRNVNIGRARLSKFVRGGVVAGWYSKWGKQNLMVYYTLLLNLAYAFGGVPLPNNYLKSWHQRLGKANISVYTVHVDHNVFQLPCSSKISFLLFNCWISCCMVAIPVTQKFHTMSQYMQYQLLYGILLDTQSMDGHKN